MLKYAITEVKAIMEYGTTIWKHCDILSSDVILNHLQRQATPKHVFADLLARLLLSAVNKLRWAFNCVQRDLYEFLICNRIVSLWWIADCMQTPEPEMWTLYVTQSLWLVFNCIRLKKMVFLDTLGSIVLSGWTIFIISSGIRHIKVYVWIIKYWPTRSTYYIEKIFKIINC